MTAASPLPGTLSVRALVEDAHARLISAKVALGQGTTSAWDEAVYLVLHALRLPPDQLQPYLSRPVTRAERRRVQKLLAARVRRRVPAAYLTREAWLGDLRFYVDERVIVPRSFIAELLRARLAPWIALPRASMSALDLCTGSGCLAVLMAKMFPHASITATDVSPAALTVARRNIAAYRLGPRIELLHSDMFAGLQSRRFDLIIANPPYVSTRSMRALPPEFRREPPLALAGGKDGFDAVRILLREAHRHLTEQGLLIVEVGHNRAALEAAYPRLPFIWLETSGGDDCVFMLAYRDLAAQPAVAAVLPLPRHRARRAVAASRRR